MIRGSVTQRIKQIVQTINGLFGNITLTSSGGTVTITTPTADTINLESSGGGSVTSVNGQTGVVVLDTGDIASVVDSRYVTDAQLSLINSAVQPSDLTAYVPYTGATTDVNIGVHTYIGHAVRADASDGLLLEAGDGTDVGILGAANTANVTWYGNHNYDTVTANTIASFGASKTLTSLSTATYPSLTELSYVKGVTSAIQTQINGKQASDATLTSLAAVAGVQGDLLYASGTDTWTRLAKNASSTRYLSNTGTSNNPAWAQINLANGVTGDLPLANLAPSSAATRLLGRGSSSGAGDFQEITIGSNLSMIGTTLSGTALPSTLVNGSGSSTDTALMRWKGTGGVTAQDSGVLLSNADAMTGLASLTFDLGTDVNEFSTDGLLAGNSDDAVPTEKAVKTYIDARADYKALISGRYYPPENCSNLGGTSAVLNDWTYFVPFLRDFAFTLNNVYIEVTTAAGGSNIRLGLYDDVNGVPTNLIATLGTVSSATTGVKSLTALAQSVSVGRFWIGFQTDAVIAVRTFGGGIIGNAHNGEIGVGGYNQLLNLSTDLTSTYAGALPTTATVTLLNTIDLPMIYIGT